MSVSQSTLALVEEFFPSPDLGGVQRPLPLASRDEQVRFVEAAQAEAARSGRLPEAVILDLEPHLDPKHPERSAAWHLGRADLRARLEGWEKSQTDFLKGPAQTNPLLERVVQDLGPAVEFLLEDVVIDGSLSRCKETRLGSQLERELRKPDAIPFWIQNWPCTPDYPDFPVIPLCFDHLARLAPNGHLTEVQCAPEFLRAMGSFRKDEPARYTCTFAKTTEPMPAAFTLRRGDASPGPDLQLPVDVPEDLQGVRNDFDDFLLALRRQPVLVQDLDHVLRARGAARLDCLSHDQKVAVLSVDPCLLKALVDHRPDAIPWLRQEARLLPVARAIAEPASRARALAWIDLPEAYPDLDATLALPSLSRGNAESAPVWRDVVELCQGRSGEDWLEKVPLGHPMAAALQGPRLKTALRLRPSLYRRLARQKGELALWSLRLAAAQSAHGDAGDGGGLDAARHILGGWNEALRILPEPADDWPSLEDQAEILALVDTPESLDRAAVLLSRCRALPNLPPLQKRLSTFAWAPQGLWERCAAFLHEGTMPVVGPTPPASEPEPLPAPVLSSLATSDLPALALDIVHAAVETWSGKDLALAKTASRERVRVHFLRALADAGRDGNTAWAAVGETWPTRTRLEGALNVTFPDMTPEDRSRVLDRAADEGLPLLFRSALTALSRGAAWEGAVQGAVLDQVLEAWGDEPTTLARALHGILDADRAVLPAVWTRGLLYALGKLREPVGGKVPGLLGALSRDLPPPLDQVAQTQLELFNRENARMQEAKSGRRRVEEAVASLRTAARMARPVEPEIIRRGAPARS